MTSKAAEQLRAILSVWKQDRGSLSLGPELVDEALADERHATVERIRAAAMEAGIYSGPMSAWASILDDEAIK